MDEKIMSVRHSTQNIGFRTEGTEGSSDIATGGAVPYYYFGGITVSPGHLPTYEKTYIPYYTSGIEPLELILVDEKVSQTLAFTMTNGLMPFFLYGDVAHSTGVYTLAFHKFPPTFTTRWESGYSGNYTIREILACKIRSTVINWDFTADYNEVTMGINIEGRVYDTTPANAAQQTPIHPVGGAQVMDAAFYKDLDTTNQVITWDADNWVNSLLKCQLTSERAHKWTKYSGNTTSSKLHSGKVNHSISFVVLRNDDTNFLADFEAQTTGTLHDLRIKLYSSKAADNNYYMDYDMKNIALAQAKPNIAIIENNEVPTYECVGTVTSCLPVFKDGVTNGTPFYVDQA
jgi:hypothetical protein